MGTPAPRRLLLSVEQAAEMLSIRRTLMMRLIYEGEVGSVTVGRRRLIPTSALEEFVDRRREEA
ncbi:MAG: helix-turn-helix domain-containing protein [Candidatus Dormiibacterota bacterium]